MSTNVPITAAYGEGISPGIMESSLHIIQEAGARIDLETIDLGGKAYLRTDAYSCRFTAGYTLSQGQ